MCLSLKLGKTCQKPGDKTLTKYYKKTNKPHQHSFGLKPVVPHRTDPDSTSLSSTLERLDPGIHSHLSIFTVFLCIRLHMDCMDNVDMDISYIMDINP